MMSATLPPELEAFVEREIASGKYRSRDEVLSEGVRILQEREKKLEQLRADIQSGIDQLDRGEGLVIEDEAAHQAYIEDIQKKGRERLKAQSNEQ